MVDFGFKSANNESSLNSDGSPQISYSSMIFSKAVFHFAKPPYEFYFINV